MPLFTLTTSGFFYKKDKAEKLEKLGFKFEEVKCDLTQYGVPDERDLSISSDHVEIKIDTLDELLSLAKEYGQIIVDLDEGHQSIEIYDDYRE